MDSLIYYLKMEKQQFKAFNKQMQKKLKLFKRFLGWIGTSQPITTPSQAIIPGRQRRTSAGRPTLPTSQSMPANASQCQPISPVSQLVSKPSQQSANHPRKPEITQKRASATMEDFEIPHTRTAPRPFGSGSGPVRIRFWIRFGSGSGSGSGAESLL